MPSIIISLTLILWALMIWYDLPSLVEAFQHTSAIHTTLNPFDLGEYSETLYKVNTDVSLHYEEWDSFQ